MPSIIKTLRVVADPNRLRILLLLRGEELSVAEMQEILTMGQSTISTHLSQLKQAGLVEDRRTGKNSLYKFAATGDGSHSTKFSPAPNPKSLRPQPTRPPCAACSASVKTKCVPSSIPSPGAWAAITFPANRGKASPKHSCTSCRRLLLPTSAQAMAALLCCSPSAPNA